MRQHEHTITVYFFINCSKSFPTVVSTCFHSRASVPFSTFNPISPCLHLGDWLWCRLPDSQGIGKEENHAGKRNRNVPFIIRSPVLRISPYDLHKSIHGTISGVFGSFGKLANLQSQILREHQHVYQLGLLDPISFQPTNIPEIPLKIRITPVSAMRINTKKQFPSPRLRLLGASRL